MALQEKRTRFRAYQLGNAGSSFSYFNGSDFTLIEARYNETNKDSIAEEMKACGVDRISNLHITSWDQDHCSASQLEEILELLKPKKIEYPGYEPHTDSGKSCLKLIKQYSGNKSGKAVQITPKYISSLDEAQKYGYNDILYHPKTIDKESSNNNSTVKLFRSGCFNVLSLGDIESTQIASGLKTYSSITKEVDVMILAHHGADNGFTTSSFIKSVKPTVAIASADYANQFAHPKQAIRDLLHKNQVKLFTTKTGDILIESVSGHKGSYKLINFKAGSSEVSSSYDFKAKKLTYLNVNADTIRARLNKGYRGPKRR